MSGWTLFFALFFALSITLPSMGQTVKALRNIGETLGRISTDLNAIRRALEKKP